MVNAARLAAAAPWLVLLLLATQATTLEAYDTSAGVTVLTQPPQLGPWMHQFKGSDRGFAAL